MQKEFLYLEEYLRMRVHDAPLHYIANPGNWGDALIRYGTIRFLQERGFTFQEILCDGRELNFSAPEGSIMLFGGGGGWCRLWKNTPKLVTALAQRFNVIVLPSTYEHPYSIPNTDFFCRDQFESVVQMPQALFCHDLAFYIGSLQGSTGQGNGYFFRTDAESAQRIPLPPTNIDISLKGSHLSPIYDLVDAVDQWAVVYTDRLHVGILGCLLGKEVHLYPGSYFKNQAVYRSSLKPYFNRVHFHEYDEESPLLISMPLRTELKGTNRIPWPIRVINLQRRADRRAAFQAYHDTLTISYTFKEAVDGQRLDPAELHTKGVLDPKCQTFTLGQLGCALSHRELWIECITSGQPLIVVEDDASVHPSLTHQLPSLLAQLPPAWDILLLGYNLDSVLEVEPFHGTTMRTVFVSTQDPSESDSPRFILEAYLKSELQPSMQRLHHAFGTCGYVVSPQGAQQLLTGCFPLTNRSVPIAALGKTLASQANIDVLMNRLYKELQAFAIVPPVIVSPNDKSQSDVSLGG